MQEVEQLKRSISLDLQDILSASKVKYYPNPSTPAHFSNKNSIHFVPCNSDESDQFVDL